MLIPDEFTTTRETNKKNTIDFHDKTTDAYIMRVFLATLSLTHCQQHIGKVHHENSVGTPLPFRRERG